MRKSTIGSAGLALLLFLFHARAAAGDCDASTRGSEMQLRGSNFHVRRGDSVSVSLSVLSKRRIDGVNFLVAFDESGLKLQGIDKAYARPDGEPFEVESIELGSSGKRTTVRGRLVFNSKDPSAGIPPSTLTVLYNLRFQVEPGAYSVSPDFDNTELFFGIREEPSQRSDNSLLLCGSELDAKDGDDLVLYNYNFWVKEPGDCDPENEVLDLKFHLRDAVARPGSPVRVPFGIQNSRPTDGFVFSIDFDEEVLEATGVEPVFQRPSGLPWDFWRFKFDNRNDTPGNAGVDEGWVAGAAIFVVQSNVRNDGIPVGEEVETLGLHFRVKPEVKVDSTEVRFLDGANPEAGWAAWPLENFASLCGRSVFPPDAHSFVLLGARFQVVEEITLFIRGDSNSDLQLDLSDATTTLDFLFLAGPRPVCPKAADANDDGVVDVSDPVSTLFSLFLGAGPLPPPAGDPGPDPTPDGLDCARPVP